VLTLFQHRGVKGDFIHILADQESVFILETRQERLARARRDIRSGSVTGGAAGRIQAGRAGSLGSMSSGIGEDWGRVCAGVPEPLCSRLSGVEV